MVFLFEGLYIRDFDSCPFFSLFFSSFFVLKAICLVWVEEDIVHQIIGIYFSVLKTMCTEGASIGLGRSFLWFLVGFQETVEVCKSTKEALRLR